jgi:poly-gamma-glutamate capsule biosynthesis protein CapA/YwtB (metallophosphatase superfamily)
VNRAATSWSRRARAEGALAALMVASAGLVSLPTPARLARAAPQPKEQTLLFTGDVMLSRSVGRRIAEEGDWDFPFRKIQPTLTQADFVFGNLECPVSDTGHDLHHKYSFRADPRALEGLQFAGFRVMSLANNHMYDWDLPALEDTVARLRAAGIVPVGAGTNALEAHYPVIYDLNGVRLAFLAYVGIPPKGATAGPGRAGVAWFDVDRVVSDIRFARPMADLVIVSLHWGVEYQRRPEPRQIKWAHTMIDAGADLVVGGHPHVVQPLESYHGRWIVYSLGNFIFDQHWPETHRGEMLKVTLRDKDIAEVTTVPIRIEPTFQADLGPAQEHPDRAARGAEAEHLTPRRKGAKPTLSLTSAH